MSWMAQDIKTYIDARVDDSTNGIAAQVTAINATRATTTPAPMQVGGDADSGQYPQVYVDLGDSVVPPVKGLDYFSMVEDFQLEVTAVLRDSNITKLKTDTENYIEAILRCLQSYSTQDGTGSFICQANGIQRADIDTMQDQTRRAATVTFTVYANQL